MRAPQGQGRRATEAREESVLTFGDESTFLLKPSDATADEHAILFSVQSVLSEHMNGTGVRLDPLWQTRLQKACFFSRCSPLPCWSSGMFWKVKWVAPAAGLRIARVISNQLNTAKSLFHSVDEREPDWMYSLFGSRASDCKKDAFPFWWIFG